MAKIAWIGLGQMGRPMAKNLVQAGHDVRGVEINPKPAAEAAAAGIRTYESVSAAVAGAEFVFTMLPNGDLVQAVLFDKGGVLESISHDAVVIDCSTIDVAQARELHTKAGERSASFLDAPVSGGVTGAAAATLTIMVGGDAQLFSTARPVLQHIGGYATHVGGPGAGQAAKVVNNMIFGICLAATCEGVALAERLGLDATVLYDIVSRSTGDNWVFRNFYPAAGVVETAPSSRDFAPGFTTALLVKDLTLALSAAKATGGSVDTALTAHRLLTEHMNAGGAQLDCTSLINPMRPLDTAVAS